MNIETKEIYSELYQVLNLLGAQYIDKLPKSLVNMLEEKRDINYNPKYTDDLPLLKQNIRKETISIIVLLHLNYWCENEDEKNKLKQILENNENKYQEELKNKYNVDNIFKNKKYIQDELNIVAMVEYKESFFAKIINKIKGIFLRK